MWTTLFLLWSVPLLLAATALARWVGGDPVINDDEMRAWFGRAQNFRWSVWMIIELVLAAAVLFVAGLLEGVLLPNFNIFLRIMVPLLTSVGLALLLRFWLRRRAPVARAAHRRAAKFVTKLLSLKSQSSAQN
jgi:hypothetical protein